MEDVVALKVFGTNRGDIALVTWGRIFDPVVEEELVAVIGQSLPRLGVSKHERIHVCTSLSEVSNHEYFYEALLFFAWERPRFGDHYEDWRSEKEHQMREGRAIYLLGEQPKSE